jgi:hypothetical protein
MKKYILQMYIEKSMVLKVERDIITSFAMSPVGGAVILGIIVETFKTDVIVVFISIKHCNVMPH